MNKFAAIAVLASSAAAVELESTKTYDRTFDMLPDEKLMASMPQGKGRDHTDWSWHLEHQEQEAEVEKAKEDVVKAREGEKGARDELEELKRHIIEADEEHNRQCQLHREEEMNLYYQCTQNDINNYALHHFGGEVRSYPRWVKEYNVCIDHIHRAKTLHLDFFLENGDVEKRPCDPQSHDSTTYIGYEVAVPEAPVKEKKEKKTVIEVSPNEYVLTETRDPNNMKSPASSEVTEIRGDSKLNRPVDIYWMDFQGEPVIYQKNLQPGESWNQRSYVGHVWQIRDHETQQVLRYFTAVPKPNVNLVLDFQWEVVTRTTTVVVDKTKITETPLNPKASCMDQAVPNWSGIWIEIWGGADEAADILSGKVKVDSRKHTQRCYTITATGDQKADLLETWDRGNGRHYDLILREDSRDYENGCMIHTTLKGTPYTQWVSSVNGDISMGDQIIEKWHKKDKRGGEKYLSAHHEIRIGDCTSDGKKTVEKKFSPGIRTE